MTETKPSNPDLKAKESPLKSILQYAAIPIALGTSLLCLLGRVYYETYLSYWGLSESLFPLSKEQSVISGFLYSLLYSARILPNLILVMIGLAIFMFVVLLSTYRPIFDCLAKWLSRIRGKAVPVVRNNVEITTGHDKLMNGIFLITSAICLFVFVQAAIVYPYGLIVNRAKENATKEHQMILAGKEKVEQFSSRAVLYVKSDSKGFDQYSGHLIQTSSTHAALYRKDTGVSIFPLANVSRMVIRENKAGVKQ